MSRTKQQNCHIDTYFAKPSYTFSEMLNPILYLFQTFNSLICSFIGSSSLYFQVPTVLSLMLTFSEINVETIDQAQELELNLF